MNGAVRDETLLRVTVPIMFVQVMSSTSTFFFFFPNGVTLVANLPLMFILLIINSIPVFEAYEKKPQTLRLYYFELLSSFVVV